MGERESEGRARETAPRFAAQGSSFSSAGSEASTLSPFLRLRPEPGLGTIPPMKHPVFLPLLLTISVAASAETEEHLNQRFSVQPGGNLVVEVDFGSIEVNTSGGNITVSGGSGTLNGGTSGGSVRVENFRGAVEAGTSGGGVDLRDVTGKIKGSTSGGSISATFSTPPSEPVDLRTTGGNVTLQLAEKSAFDLDASTTGGSVKCALSVATQGKPWKEHLRGPVNGGGTPVVLRTVGGSIQVKKL